MAAAARDIDFAADDRLHAARGGLVIEMLGGKEVAVVGDGDGGHAAAGGFVNQFRDVASAVEKTVIGVQMQVDETRSFHRRLHCSLRAREFSRRTPRYSSTESTTNPQRKGGQQRQGGDDE